MMAQIHTQTHREKKEGFMKEYKYEEFVCYKFFVSIVCVWFEDI